MTTLNAPNTAVRQLNYARPAPSDQSRKTNVASVERLIGGLAGAGLVLYGVGRRDWVGMALALAGVPLLHRSTTGYCPAYGVLGINTARRGSATPEDFFLHGIHVEKSYTILKPAAELYRFWHDFANLPKFMTHLQSVEVLTPTRSRWTATAPMGTVSWEAEIIHDQPDHLISWRSLPGADVDNAGTITFIPRPGDGGTEVRVNLEYIPPAGQIGAAVASLFGEEPTQQVREDLRRFKHLMETGEIPTTEGQSRGTCVK